MPVKGGNELILKLKGLAEKFPGAAAAALYQEAVATMGESIREVPVDTGRLRASAYVAPPENVGGRVRVKFGYGTAYGLAVHERDEARHKIGKARFLKDPMDRRNPGYAARLAERIEQNIRAGITTAILDGQLPTSAPSEEEIAKRIGKKLERKRLAKERLAKRRAAKGGR